MLRSLTLECIELDEKDFVLMNKCFPNLQVLNLINVWGREPYPGPLTLAMPYLTTLKIVGVSFGALYVEAPVLHSHFHLSLNDSERFESKCLRI